MKRDLEPKGEVELPVGSATADTPADEPRFGKCVCLKEKRERVWYLVWTKVEFPPAGQIFGTKHSQGWEWAYTKSEIRRRAVALELTGHRVVDIFQGTRRNMRHKFKGLNNAKAKSDKNPPR